MTKPPSPPLKRRITLPTSFTADFMDRLAVLNDRYENGHVFEVYGSFHSTRPAKYLPRISDTMQIVNWSARYFKQFHLIGYSFGAFIGQSLHAASPLSFTGITPPLAEHDFCLADLSCPTSLIFAGGDRLLHQAAEPFPVHAIVHEIADCDHFFIRREQEVTWVEAFLLQR